MRRRITIDEAQPLIGLPIRSVQAMALRGEIPGAAKFRRRWTFDQAALETWIAQKVAETTRAAQRRNSIAAGASLPTVDFRPTYDNEPGHLARLVRRLRVDVRERTKKARIKEEHSERVKRAQAELGMKD